MSFTKSNGIEKPDLDDRDYKLITLPNKLTALLISDPKTDKSAAALDVNVGAFSDYEHLPGLAHFCEHLLFMGTEKYPSENEYSEYLSNHSGHSNAYTASEDTNYYFEVHHENLDGALDRFSQFFISPLFDASCKDREIKAVDSENKKNLQNDTWRLHQLDKSLSNPVHPFHKFSTGNYQTLGEIPASQGIDVRQELLKFYKESYSANLMKLAVIGREDLSTLEKWVQEKFSQVPNFNTPKPTYEGEVYSSKEVQKLVKAKPVMNQNRLSISFNSPDQNEFWDVQSSHYYSHLIGHEANGSILALLKKKGWANGLSAGGYTISEGNGTFGVNIDLTEKGVSHYEEITYIVFQYLKLLQVNGVQKWIHDELRQVSEINFKFKQKSAPSGTVSSLAKDLQKRFIPDENILSKYVIKKFDADLIKQFGDSLNTDSLRLTLISQSVETNQTEKWYGTEYSIENISPDFLSKLSNAELNNELYLPKVNDFIPTNFEVIKQEVSKPLKKPVLIQDDSKVRTWYKKDDQFWVPKAHVQLNMNLPATVGTPYNTGLTRFFIDLFEDSLIDISYNAQIAGLNFSLHPSKDGITMSFSGYNDKMSILIEQVLEILVEFIPESERFEIIKEKILRNMQNARYSPPYNQVTGVFSNLINEHSFSIEEKIEAYKNITFTDLKNFIPLIFKQAFVEALIVGNYQESEALKVSQIITDTIKAQALFESQYTKPRSYLLPESKSFRYEMFLPDEKNINTCTQYFLQVGEVQNNEKVYATADLVAQLIKEPAFDVLRTKEQLGYIVFSGVLETRTTFGLRVIVQSERNASYLESRIDNFFKQYHETLLKMSDEKFEENKQALIHRKLESLKNLSQENNRFHGAISTGYYDFLHKELEAETLKTVTKSDVEAFYDKYVLNNHTKLIVNLHAKGNTDNEQVVGFPTGDLIENCGDFKAHMYLTPAPKPVEEVTMKNFGPKL